MSWRGEFDAIKFCTEFEQSSSMLGKTIWQDGNGNSIFITDMNLHQPHGHSRTYAEYCVEAMGPDISTEDVIYWHFDDYKEALDKVMEMMKQAVDDDVFQENREELKQRMTE